MRWLQYEALNYFGLIQIYYQSSDQSAINRFWLKTIQYVTELSPVNLIRFLFSIRFDYRVKSIMFSSKLTAADIVITRYLDTQTHLIETCSFSNINMFDWKVNCCFVHKTYVAAIVIITFLQHQTSPFQIVVFLLRKFCLLIHQWLYWEIWLISKGNSNY